jgi:hypothetical protein
MAFNFEALLVTLVFILPGFLTSRLVESRTPARSRQTSAFSDTIESLVRSVYLQAILGVGVIVLLIILRALNSELHACIFQQGIQACSAQHPVQAFTVLITWLIATLGLATLFGAYWDPLDYAYRKIGAKVGNEFKDLFYMPVEIASLQRKQGNARYQLWLQVRLKNGYTYRGELNQVSLPANGENRELLLSHVKFFPYPAQVEGAPNYPPRTYDHVYIDMANCESIEMLYSKPTITSIEDSQP